MKFEKYQRLLLDRYNDEALISTLTSPFGFEWSHFGESDLLVGHILEALSVEVKKNDIIDCFDVAAVAYELGCAEAGRFLDHAPEMIFNEMSLEFSSAV